MTLSALTYSANLLRLATGDRLLRPLTAAYFVTTDCNLNCVYCENYGYDVRGDRARLQDALKILHAIRHSVERLILTGGEPLLHPQIGQLVSAARGEVGFRHITLISNGLLLPQHEQILPALDLLVVSLDSTDPEQWHSIIGVETSAAALILGNIVKYAARQRELGFHMVANCVLTPQTLSGATDVLDFCAEHGLMVSFSPQAVNNWPHYDLLVSDEYKALLGELLTLKRRGAPIAGSEAYLHSLRGLRPYSCYPTLTPSITPAGELVYPCRPVEKGGGALGGRPASLLEVGSLREALRLAQAELGTPPRVCNSCFQQCFVEPSLMQARPLSLLYELLRYGASRRVRLASYAPG